MNEKVEIKAVEGKRWNLTKQDIQKWFDNQKSFLAPLGILYLGFVIAEVAKDGVGLGDFIPDNGAVTGMALYVLNGLYDLFKKWSDTKKYIIS